MHRTFCSVRCTCLPAAVATTPARCARLCVRLWRTLDMADISRRCETNSLAELLVAVDQSAGLGHARRCLGAPGLPFMLFEIPNQLERRVSSAAGHFKRHGAQVFREESVFLAEFCNEKYYSNALISLVRPYSVVICDAGQTRGRSVPGCGLRVQGSGYQVPGSGFETLSRKMYLLISFRKSTPPQNCQLIIYYY